MIYESVNGSVLPCIPKATKRLLDVGCGSGALGQIVKQKIDCEIVGITYSELEKDLASKCLNEILVRDLNSFSTKNLGKFDCIICSHVLEHLYQPQELLKQLKNNLTSEGIIIVALPNVLHWKQRVRFLRGRFEYTNGGIMDETHFRFFDWKTSFDLLKESGFEVTFRSAEGYLPLPIFRNIMFKPLTDYLDNLATKISPGFFGLQFIIVAKIG